MFNILHVVPTLGYGGVAKVVINYYNALDHSKYHFDFITHGGIEDYHSQLVQNGSEIYYFNTIGKVGFNMYAKQILSKIALDKYDIIHIHTGDITGLYAKCFKKCGAKKVICHAHTTRAVSKTHKYFKWYLQYMALKYSDLRLACGYKAGQYCYGDKDFSLLPNSIDFEEFNNVNMNTVKSLKEEWGISDDRYIIGHVGHFSPQKNHFFLIEIIESFVKKHSNVTFIMCGNGPRFEDVKNRIEEKNLTKHVILTGIRRDINVIMKLFDLFILPSLYEGLPVVGIEAQTAGLMCLFSDQIDRYVDIGCNLSKFLPIDKGIEPWVSAIEACMINTKKANVDDIKKALYKNGYDIRSAVSILEKAYDSLLTIK